MVQIVENKGKWDEKELSILKDLYGKIPANEIAKKIGRTKSAVQLKANRVGLMVEDKYTYNKDFFEVIDNEEKAYWYGFIVADGCVTHTQRCSELSIKLKASDDKHLKKFNKSIDGNVEVTYVSRLGVFNNELYDNKKYYDSCQIRFYSQKLVSDLMKLEVYPDKSHKEIKFPSLPENLIWHFIRGFLDGDGHLCVPKENKIYGYRAGFTCNCESFLISLKEFLKMHNIISHIQPSRNNFKLEIRNKQSLLLFLEYCYKNPIVYLERKYNKFQQLHKLLSKVETP